MLGRIGRSSMKISALPLALIAVSVGLSACVAPPEQPWPVAASSYCREFHKDVTIDGQKQSAHGTACLQADGSWAVMPDGQYGAPGWQYYGYGYPYYYAYGYPGYYDPWYYGWPYYGFGGDFVFFGGDFDRDHHHDHDHGGGHEGGHGGGGHGGRR